MNEVNAQRLQTAIRQKKAVRGEDGKYHFASTSFDANALNADPALGLSYIVAPPRMQRYLDVSTQIYKIYLKYVSPADIYPYSIDEVFIDVTGYLPYYHMSAHELAMTMVREVLYNTGITATAGIGTNLYLAKLAMDIVAKHLPADKEGVRIAVLDELYLWLSNPVAIEYIRNCLKRVRKRDSALVMASQNLEDFDQEGVREMTKPLFAIPPHQFLFNPGSIGKQFYMDMLQLDEAEFELIQRARRGECLYKCGMERYHLEVKAPTHKAVLFGSAGGR